jgi:hypothetical protein
MKFNTIVRCQLMLVAALVAALFVTSSAFAQEEVERTTFSDGPYVTSFTQPQATTAKASDAMTMEASNGAVAVVGANDEVAVDEAAAAAWTPTDSKSTIALMVGILGLVLFGVYREKRMEQRILCPTPLTPSDLTAR